MRSVKAPPRRTWIGSHMSIPAVSPMSRRDARFTRWPIQRQVCHCSLGRKRLDHCARLRGAGSLITIGDCQHERIRVRRD